MREFTDPFTGEPLENPEAKSYRVTYSVAEFGREETVVDTLAKGRLTKAQAKEKLLGRPRFAMTSPHELQIISVNRID